MDKTLKNVISHPQPKSGGLLHPPTHPRAHAHTLTHNTKNTFSFALGVRVRVNLTLTSTLTLAHTSFILLLLRRKPLIARMRALPRCPPPRPPRRGSAPAPSALLRLTPRGPTYLRVPHTHTPSIFQYKYTHEVEVKRDAGCLSCSMQWRL